MLRGTRRVICSVCDSEVKNSPQCEKPSCIDYLKLLQVNASEIYNKARRQRLKEEAMSTSLDTEYTTVIGSAIKDKEVPEKPCLICQKLFNTINYRRYLTCSFICEKFYRENKFLSIDTILRKWDNEKEKRLNLNSCSECKTLFKTKFKHKKTCGQICLTTRTKRLSGR